MWISRRCGHCHAHGAPVWHAQLVTTRRAASGEPARQGRRPIGQRTRARLLGGAVALAGVLNIVSALTPEIRSRLSVVDAVLEQNVITTAAGTTALFGMLQ